MVFGITGQFFTHGMLSILLRTDTSHCVVWYYCARKRQRYMTASSYK